MNKNEVYRFLDQKQIWHEITEHPAVYNMEQLEQVTLPYPGCDAKNLFVRDDKRRNYYLITVKGDKRVNLKDFRPDHRQGGQAGQPEGLPAQTGHQAPDLCLPRGAGGDPGPDSRGGDPPGPAERHRVPGAVLH